MDVLTVIKLYLEKAITTPPYILVRKVLAKAGKKAADCRRKQRDLTNDTHINFDLPIISRSYVDVNTLDTSGIQLDVAVYLSQMYCEHRFDLLGSGWVQQRYDSSSLGLEGHKYDMNVQINNFDTEGIWLNEILLPAHLEYSQKIWQEISGDYIPIDWQKDYKSGFRWNAQKWYKHRRIYKLGVDIKVPWELARMQHLPQMAIFAKMLPQRRKDLILEFKNQILDFIATNPPRMGVNWNCTMDVGIRVANMVVAYNLFCPLDYDGIINKQFKQIFANSVYEHGLHIVSNLEWYEKLTSNHYLSDIAGLVHLGIFFRDTKSGEKWLNFAVKELKKEMKRQVYPDGCDFEASTCYHRLVLELFFYSTYFVVIDDEDFNGENYRKITEDVFGTGYTKKLYKMFDAVLYLLKPNGRMPQIGDNDSGQLFKLHHREVLDMKYLLSLGAVFFKESKWKIKEFFESEEDIAEVLILYGKIGKKIWDSLEWNLLKNIKSKAFPDAGWYVMRDNMNYCIISCGPNGQNGNGGHCHNDKLSFELCIDGEDVIVDPGTYVYTSDLGDRNIARSTLSHNTLCVDFQEQNPFDRHNWTILKDKSFAKSTKWDVNNEEIVFEGVHYGYSSFSEVITHRRKIIWQKIDSKILVEDHLELGRATKSQHFLTISFNVVDREPILKNNTVFLKRVCIECLKNTEKVKPRINNMFFCKGYGYRRKIKKIIFEIKPLLPCDIRTVICYKSDQNDC